MVVQVSKLNYYESRIRTMTEPTPHRGNPTDSIDLDFPGYVDRRQRQLSIHAPGDVPDYSFALDGTLRRQLAAIGPIRSIAQIMVSTNSPLARQRFLMYGVAVGPKVFPNIYAMGEDCARRLGIGIPQIFILNDSNPGAFTIATDDTAPVIVLTSSLVNLLEPDELQFVIGHECGHVHNLHGVYNSAVVMLVNPVARVLFQQLSSFGATLDTIKLLAGILQGSLKLFMLRWSRCAEVTCDRAGLICCGNLQAAEQSLIKLVAGGSAKLTDIDVNEYLKQLKQIRSAPASMLEFQSTHPLIAKRIEALRVFAACEVLHAWRPEMTTPEQSLTRVEADRRCEEIIGILKRDSGVQ
jgi:Zn-dependent protease with chaperone function